MLNIENNKTIFENIKHIDEFGNEYWEARELMKALEYTKWQNFHKVVKNAIISCKNSNYKIFEQFTEVSKPLTGGNGNKQIVIDYHLSRYACYLIIQNCDPRKEVVALGQTYFAIQTRKMELTEKEYSSLSEIDKRFYQRDLTKKGNYSLNQTAKNAGVKDLLNFIIMGIRVYIMVKQQMI